MTIHFTSDLHWGHRNIIKYSNRPFDSVEHMNDSMVRKWNIQVAPNDTVYSLGDWAFGKIEFTMEILKRLNGNIHMILGNHDKEIKNHRKLLIDEGLVKFIKDYDEIYVGNVFVCLFHYGQRVWNKSHHGSWQLFGHSHGSLPPYGKSVDVGVDSPYITGKPEYRPFSFDEIRDFMDKQETLKVDHH